MICELLHRSRGFTLCAPTGKAGVSLLIKKFLGVRWIKYASLEASGTKGGISMLWDSRAWEGDILETGIYFLICFESQFYNCSCHITGVYAPNYFIEKRSVWEEMGLQGE